MLGLLLSLLLLLVIVVIAITIVNYMELDPPLRKVVILVIGVLCLLWLLLMISGQAPMFFAGPRVTLR
jgi:hypothetical protein